MSQIQCGHKADLSRPRRLMAVAVCVLLTACGLGSQPEGAKVGLVEGFAGVVAADAPGAAVVARDILGNGGNAADAAAAMYFALAVTLPSRASLGGGGVCAVFDNGDKTGEALDFLPRPSGQGLVPLGVRAMAALHARQGILTWAEVIAPAETLARFGYGVGRTLAQDLDRAAALVAADPALAAMFRAASGQVAREGDRLTQLELSAVLGGLRARGAAYVHAGPFANRFVEATASAGHAIAPEDLRDSVPLFEPAPAIEIGDDTAYFSGPSAGGIVAGQLWRILTEEADYDGTSGAGRAHLFGEAAMRAFADRAAWLGDAAASNGTQLIGEARAGRVFQDYDAQRHKPARSLSPAPREVAEDSAGTSFAVADRFGNAVACSLTMNRLFGAGRVASGTGILLAAPPRPTANGFLSPAAVVVGNTVNGDLRFAAAASGGAAAPTALAQVMLGALEDGEGLEAAMRAARVHHGGLPDELFYETGLRQEVVAELLSRGHSLQEAAALGSVEAIYCPEGIIDDAETCEVASDPRGPGLATVVR